MLPLILVTVLLAAVNVSSYTVQPAGTLESVTVHSDHDDREMHLQHVQMLYDALGGSFVLPVEGADGKNLTVNGIHLYKYAANSTVSRSEQISPILDDNSIAIDPRAPIGVDSRRCYENGQFGDRFFSQSQILFLDGTFCKFVGRATPSFYAVIGLVVSNVACGTVGGLGPYTCQGVFTVAAAVAGEYIQRAWLDECDASVKALQQSCGAIGGQEVVTVSGQKYNVETYATTESGHGCSGPNNRGGSDCFTYDCHRTCG